MTRPRNPSPRGRSGMKKSYARRSKKKLWALSFLLLVVAVWATSSLWSSSSPSSSSSSPLPSRREPPTPSPTAHKNNDATTKQETAQKSQKKINTNQNERETMNVAKRVGRVVIVGSGLAGQSAAIEAARHGAREVILLEKEGRMGGNSAKATSGINGWGTEAQRLAHVDDNSELFVQDTLKSGKGGFSDVQLVETLSAHSGEAVAWLSSFGVPLTVLSQLGGASRKRCHRAPDKADGTPLPIGFTMVKTLETYIRSELADRVRIETNARMTGLLHNADKTAVTGVLYRQPIQKNEQEEVEDVEVRLDADAVILATGGFSNDHTDSSLLQQYAPQLASYPTTNGIWATGDGVKAARALDVHLVDMDKVQLHPTGLLNPKDPHAKTVFLGPEALRGSGGILLNQKGERFVNELDLRSVVSQAILAQDNVYPGSGDRRFAYCVLNDAAADAFGRATLRFYWKKMGLFQEAATPADLAALLGCNASTLRQTLEQYEKISGAEGATCPLTGKKVFPCVLGPQGPYYVALVTPSIHYTMGGCLISPSAEVLQRGPATMGDEQQQQQQRKIIKGLFGAGEVTGGVHGGNRLGGNSLLECVVFGRIAGKNAAAAAFKSE